MKKLTLYIIVIAMLFVWTGCGKEEAPAHTAATTAPAATKPVPETEPTATEPPIDVAQQPMTAVYLPEQTEKTLAEDGTLLFCEGTQSMVLTAEDPDVADRIILDFLNRTDSHSGVPDLIAFAQYMHENNYAGNLPLWSQTRYTPQRIDQGILSLFGYDRSFQGGVHPDTNSKSVTYDLLTGNALSLSDILTEDMTMDALCALVTAALEEHASRLYPEYKQLVAEMFRESMPEYDAWYLSGAGLCFYFSHYEIAAYSSGIIVATIPYSELSGKLQDAYFPPEQDIARGKLIQTDFSTDVLAQFTQIAEVPLSDNGKKVVLHTDYSIHDVRILQETQIIGNHEYSEAVTVFAAAGLTPGDAIVVQIPEGSKITVTYSANGQTLTEELSF